MFFCRFVFAREEVVADFYGKVPAFKKANQVFQKSCVQCHSAQVSLPWYARTPGIKSKMKREYRDSLSAFNLDSEVYVPGQPPTQKALDGIESIALDNSRHPRTKVFTHRKARLSPSSRLDILNWIHDERAVTQAHPVITVEPVPIQKEAAKPIDMPDVKPVEKLPSEPETYNPFKPR